MLNLVMLSDVRSRRFSCILEPVALVLDFTSTSPANLTVLFAVKVSPEELSQTLSEVG